MCELLKNREKSSVCFRKPKVTIINMSTDPCTLIKQNGKNRPRVTQLAIPSQENVLLCFLKDGSQSWLPLGYDGYDKGNVQFVNLPNQQDGVYYIVNVSYWWIIPENRSDILYCNWFEKNQINIGNTKIRVK